MSFSKPTPQELLRANSSCVQFEATHSTKSELVNKLISVIVFIVCIVVLFIKPNLTLYFLIAGIVYIYLSRRSRLADIAKLQICKRKNWHYDPEVREDKGKTISNLLGGKYFGDSAQFVKDQIWSDYFYTAQYAFVTGSGKNKVRRTFSILGINANLGLSFDLSPQFMEMFTTDKELQLESEKFNKIFQFSYSETKEKMQPKITKILTPLMQTKLIDLALIYGKFTVCFREKDIFFVFSKPLYSPSIKNILTLTIDDTEIAKLESKLMQFADFAVGVKSENS